MCTSNVNADLSNTMSAKFFTNRDSNTLFNKFAGVFTYNKNINNFDVLVGYFRSSGYFKIRPFLENIANIRILVGINVDKITADMQQQGLALFKGDDDQTFKHWQQQFIEDAQNARYDQQTEQGILQFTDDMRQQKLELKAHPSKKIHAKIYIFRPDNFNEHNSGSVITGSSNLTSAGLGIQTASNYEFNVLQIRCSMPYDTAVSLRNLCASSTITISYFWGRVIL